jgi:hypothetical protein
VLGALCVIAACGGADDGEASPDPPLDPQVEVAVDPRVELLSIVFGLVGSPEYAEAYPSPWRDAVNEQFEPLRDHEAVVLARGLRAEYGISFDAPVDLAVYLDPATLLPTRPLAPLPPGLDPLWEGAPIDPFLAALADFAEAGGFDRVYAENAAYRGEAEDRLTAVVADQPIIESFEKLFGPRPGTRFRVVPGLLTGPYNYSATAVAPDGSSEYVQVIGVEFAAAQTLELVVHEMAHAYVNPIFDARAEALAAVSAPAFASEEAQMRAQNYIDAPTMVNELVVRAVTIVYVRDHVDDDRAAALILEEEDRGFRWIAPLVARLDGLREQYPDGPIPEDELVDAVRAALE